MTQSFHTNLHCANCVRTVTNFLNEVPGVTAWSIDTDAEKKVLTVEGSAKREQIIAAVEEAGFDIEAIKP